MEPLAFPRADGRTVRRTTKIIAAVHFDIVVSVPSRRAYRADMVGLYAFQTAKERHGFCQPVADGILAVEYALQKISGIIGMLAVFI